MKNTNNLLNRIIAVTIIIVAVIIVIAIVLSGKDTSPAISSSTRTFTNLIILISIVIIIPILLGMLVISVYGFRFKSIKDEFQFSKKNILMMHLQLFQFYAKQQVIYLYFHIL